MGIFVWRLARICLASLSFASSATAAGGPAWDFIFKGSSFSQQNQPASNLGISLFVAGTSHDTGTFSTPDGAHSGTVLMADKGTGIGQGFGDFAQFLAADATPNQWSLNATTSAGSASYHFAADFSQIALPQAVIRSPAQGSLTSNQPTFRWTSTGTPSTTFTTVQVSNANFSVNIQQTLLPGQTSFTVPTSLPVGDYSFYLFDSLITQSIPVTLTHLSGPDLQITPNGTFSFLDEAYDAFTVAAPGDANNDGKVDIADLGILATNYGKAGTFATGDFNGDGVVNIADLGILATQYGASNSASLSEALSTLRLRSVPEPVALVGLGFLSAGLFRMRNRATA